MWRILRTTGSNNCGMVKGERRWWREREEGKTQVCAEEFPVPCPDSQPWENHRQSGWACGNHQENCGVFRVEDLGLRRAPEAESQTVTSSANSGCKSKSNPYVCTAYKGLEVTDWSFPLRPHTQIAITDSNIIFA